MSSEVNNSLKKLVCSLKIECMSDLIVPSLHLIFVQVLLLILCFSRLKKYLVDFSPSSKFLTLECILAASVCFS